MKRIKTQAIVLKKKNLLDKNLLITFFTKDFGKINVFGFGIKKITSKRISSLQTGNLVDIIITKKDGKFHLEESVLKSTFYQIKKNHKKTKILYLIFFILDRILAENQQEKVIYKLVIKFLIDFSKKDIDLDCLFNFINKILIKLGFLKEKLGKEKLFVYIEELINERIPNFLRV